MFVSFIQRDCKQVKDVQYPPKIETFINMKVKNEEVQPLATEHTPVLKITALSEKAETPLKLTALSASKMVTPITKEITVNKPELLNSQMVTPATSVRKKVNPFVLLNQLNNVHSNENSLKNNHSKLQTVAKTPVLNRTFEKMNSTVILDTIGAANNSQKSILANVCLDSGAKARSGSRKDLLKDNLDSKKKENECPNSHGMITRSGSKRKSSGAKNKSSKKQKIDCFDISSATLNKSAQPRHPLRDLKASVLASENKAKLSAVIKPTVQQKQPLVSKEQQMLEEIKKKEKKREENLQKLMAERQLKAEQTKKNREKKRTKTLQKRMQMEKEKEEKCEMEAKKSQVKINKENPKKTTSKRNIASANFASHSAFCHRNIIICQECKEPVPKKATKEHEAESHIFVKCDWCTISVKKWMLPQHQDSCLRRPFICEFCDADMPFNESEKHIKFCGVRTEKCSLCSKYIMLKDKQKHSEEMCSQRHVVCEFCKHDFPFDEIEVHFEACGNYPEKCSLCSHYFVRKDRKEHFENHDFGKMIPKENGDRENDQNLTNEIISKKTKNVQGIKASNKNSVPSEKSNSNITDDFGSMVGATACVPEKSKQVFTDFTVCHSCRQHISWEDYESHVKACVMASMSDSKKCPHCDQFLSPVTEHNVMVCENRKHLRMQSNAFESMRKESRSVYHTFDELPIKRPVESTSCPICDQLFPIDELSEHLKSCTTAYVQCQLCHESVLSEDWNSHFSSKCKMLQERVLCDFYECPLCGENLPESEKTIHESFKCKVLLEIHDGPLYSLSEKTHTKRPKEETQKNSTDVCLRCKNTVPKHQLANHKKSCNQNSNTVCAYCEKEVPVGSEDFHLTHRCEVYPQIKKINHLERVNDHKGAKPKYSKLSEIAMPKVGQCLYCKTTLNENILLFHQNECVHQPIKCSDCSKSILLKDYDNHKCKLSKGKDKGKRDKGHQKPEKSENQSWFSSFFGGKSNPYAKTLGNKKKSYLMIQKS